MRSIATPCCPHSELVVSFLTTFQLGKVMPGQGAGSQWWYEDLTGVLCADFQMIQCEEYPNLLCNPDRT